MRGAYRLLLRLYPPEYRIQFADEMLAVFSRVSEERRVKGRVAYMRFVAGECAGLLMGALGERSMLRIAPALGGIALAAGMHAAFYSASWKILKGTVGAVGRTPMPLADPREAAVTMGALAVVTLLCLMPIFFLVSMRLNRRRR